MPPTTAGPTDLSDMNWRFKRAKQLLATIRRLNLAGDYPTKYRAIAEDDPRGTDLPKRSRAHRYYVIATLLESGYLVDRNADDPGVSEYSLEVAEGVRNAVDEWIEQNE